jgi:hypothetical protein
MHPSRRCGHPAMPAGHVEGMKIPAAATVLLVLGFVAVPKEADAHGAMNLPRSRNMGRTPAKPSPAGGSVNHGGCDGASCMWFNQGCCIGCKTCVDTFINNYNASACGLKEALDTLPAAARTINSTVDFTQHHPWRSPGAAPMLDSCGLSGGSTVNNDHAGGFGKDTIAHRQGARGSELPRLDGRWTLKWTAGEEAEVSWGISANHGGGYQYRLCPANEALTEECFQKTPLKFSGAKSWLRWNNGHQVEIDALRVTNGTTPSGSEWTRNPIPTCAGDGNEPCTLGPAFPPPTGCNETCWGYQPNGSYAHGSNTVEMPAIVDKVLIPPGLPSGNYVVGWRWDCEQTVQIWSSCGDVVVSGGSPGPGPAPTPSPTPGPEPIAAKCLKWLNTECRMAKKEGPPQCMQCTGEHAVILKLAHCAEADFLTYCNTTTRDEI